MIPRSLRLPSTHTLISPQRFQTPLFSLRIGKNNTEKNRFAFIVGKRVDKRAVVRNRLRRLLREIVLEILPLSFEGRDMIFIVRRNFLEAPRMVIEDEVKELLTKVS